MQDCMLPWVAAASTNRGQHAPSSHRNLRCWKEAKSVASFASDTRCAALSRSTADTCAANSHTSTNGAVCLSPAHSVRLQAASLSPHIVICRPAHSVRLQAVPERQRRGIPQPSPTGWVTGPPMYEPCKGGIMARINPKHIVRHMPPDTVRGMCEIRLETTIVGDVPPGCRYSELPRPHRIG